VPILQQGYRRRAERGAERRFRGAPIARLTVQQILVRRMLIALLAVALAPLVIGVFVLFLLSRVPDFWSALPNLHVLFGYFVRAQTVFALVLTVWAGTGLLADDFRTGAFLVYFARPITRGDYVAGKLGVLLVLTFAVTAGPSLALWLAAAAFGTPVDPTLRGPLQTATEHLPGGVSLPLAILAQSLAASLVLSVLGLAAGAAARNATLGGALLIGFLVVTDAGAAFAPAGARLPLELLTVRRHLLSLEHVLFGASPDPDLLPWAAALACLAAIVAGALALVWRRLQAVEVVA
jgi:ABC-type transport system involved in multi-copper enzyme maturation permease subunit